MSILRTEKKNGFFCDPPTVIFILFLDLNWRSSQTEVFSKKGAFINFIKKRLWYRCFPVNFAKFLRIPFLTKHCQWLLLKLVSPKANRRLGVRVKWQLEVYEIRGYQII